MGQCVSFRCEATRHCSGQKFPGEAKAEDARGPKETDKPSSDGPLAKVPAHDKRACPGSRGISIVIRPTADLLKTKPPVKRYGNRVRLVHFQEKGGSPVGMKTAQDRIHQLTAKPLPAFGARYDNGEDFPLIRRLAGEHETRWRGGTPTERQNRETENRILRQKRFKLGVTPRTGEAFCMKIGE